MIEIPGILVLYHAPFTGRASTVREHVDAFGKYSHFPVVYVNTDLGFPHRLRDFSFQVVVLHYSLFATGGYHLDADFLQFLDAHRDRYRIAFFQDEHHYCRQRFAFLNDHHIDCVYTLVEPEYVPKVYGQYTHVPDVIYGLPGYVTTELEDIARKPARSDAERTVDVGYRGRKLAAYMGKGGQEKYDIAVEFRRRAAESGLTLDIEAEETQRIYGNAWFDFIGRCRAVLGVESGVSTFDLEDTIRPAYERLTSKHPDLTFDQISDQLLGPYENVIPYRTISPRHFEAAALGTSQILFEGNYSGLMEPFKHYIPLKKDYSNFDDVLGMFRDQPFRASIAANARRDLIESGAYTYRSFISEFDRALQARGMTPGDGTFDRSVIDAALHEGATARRLRRRLAHARQQEFPGRNLLKPFVKPLIDRYGERQKNDGARGASG